MSRQRQDAASGGRAWECIAARARGARLSRVMAESAGVLAGLGVAAGAHRLRQGACCRAGGF
eukprot:13464706-Alexandrium_andersonii.AAC.1